MVSQYATVQDEDVGDEPVVVTECLYIAPCSADERGPVVFAESSRRGAKSIAKTAGPKYVDHLGKIDNRRLRRVDARYQAPSHIRAC